MTSNAQRSLDSLRAAVAGLASRLDARAASSGPAIEAALSKHRASALNLAHYLGLRTLDVRALQLELAAVGLSSLGRCEGHVRDTIAWLLAWLDGEAPKVDRTRDAATQAWPDAAQAERRLHENTRALLGPRPGDRHVYIMVTAPEPEFADDAWADGLIGAGANLLRINAAHGTPAGWERVAATFRARARLRGIPVRITVDMPGPKLRVDISGTETGVIRIRRRKDELGRTVGPVTVPLVSEVSAPGQVPIPAQWLAGLQLGDVVVVTDSRQREVPLVVRERVANAVHADSLRSLYAITGLALRWERGAACLGKGLIGAIPEAPRRVALSVGDLFLVSGEAAAPGEALPVLRLAEAQLLSKVAVGERVVLDDGRIVAQVEALRDDGLLCRVTAAVKSVVRIRDGKGIALPDSNLELPALGPEDEVALAFALRCADAVGVSFVNCAADVARVGERIRESGRPGFGMILKLETRSALGNLPSILFEALKYDPVGLMIARGDLAMDLGFERLAEMQEELLWFGEACHLPVIWATQVLESVTHTGLPTRAEVTDAAMAMRAECVMLNKGPYVAEANRLLADIIRKMEAHQYKKRALMRPLSLAANFAASESTSSPSA